MKSTCGMKMTIKIIQMMLAADADGEKDWFVNVSKSEMNEIAIEIVVAEDHANDIADVAM
ncbi:hypothetical protein [Lederbergia lenta]|uniref:hypothetical protein n=1 Tax=Lederbergia lenta TaxID=1467 RepID=UPI0011AE7506|nr:hypothetical protein [Lederbergia lenta]MEC2326697.1 hypothetical protein [Lederbergia lenta]